MLRVTQYGLEGYFRISLALRRWLGVEVKAVDTCLEKIYVSSSHGEYANVITENHCGDLT